VRAHPLALLAIAAAAPAFAAERAPEYDALQLFVGAWTQQGSESVFREDCDWFEGRHQVVCHSTRQRDDGSVSRGMSLLGYTPADGYVYTGIGSRGRFEMLRGGRFQDGRFVFESTATEDGKAVASRITIGPRTDAGFHFVVETSTDGGPWTHADTTVYLLRAPEPGAR
jgi:hypothetical protein